MCSCPVKILSQIVTDMIKHSIDNNTLPCTRKHGRGMSNVASKGICKTLKDAAKARNLQQRGFPVSRTCLHPLCAGSAMSLKLANGHIQMIKKHGWRSSDTSLTHAHDHTCTRASIVTRNGVYKAMDQLHDFPNITGCEMQHTK